MNEHMTEYWENISKEFWGSMFGGIDGNMN